MQAWMIKPMRGKCPPISAGGFTLVELMITMAILGIITSIAMFSYQDYIKQGRRTEAVTNLTQLGMLVEQNRALYGTYCHPDPSEGCGAYSYSESDAGVPAAGNEIGPGKDYLSGFRPKQATTGAAVRYTYTVTVTTNGYDLTAAPVASRNAPDETLALDEEGVKKETVGTTTTYGW